ncbi:MAG: hypothetical protein J7M25_04885 [Deltaproteobacteria bacterium]|nr:hypothetical protein [Deltaproteobacteria bacterium]
MFSTTSMDWFSTGQWLCLWILAGSVVALEAGGTACGGGGDADNENLNGNH